MRREMRLGIVGHAAEKFTPETEAKAREYSKQRIDRMLVASPKLNALQSTNKRDDNTHDKCKRNVRVMRIHHALPLVTVSLPQPHTAMRTAPDVLVEVELVVVGVDFDYRGT